MSIQAVGWVLDYSTATGAARLVLLSIANHANDRGQSWPGKATIAREAKVSLDSVKRCLGELETGGHLGRVVNGAPDERIPRDRRPNLYTVLDPKTGQVIHRGWQDDPPAGVAGAPERGGQRTPNGGGTVPPQTIIDPSKNRGQSERSSVDNLGRLVDGAGNPVDPDLDEPGEKWATKPDFAAIRNNPRVS